MSGDLIQLELWIERALRKPKGDAKLIKGVDETVLALLIAQELQKSLDENTLTKRLSSLGRAALIAADITPTGNIAVDNKRHVKIGNFLMHLLVENNKIVYDNSIEEEKKGFEEGKWRVFKADGTIIVSPKKKTQQDPYRIKIVDDRFIDSLIYAANVERPETHLSSRPLTVVPEDVTGFHGDWGDLVRNAPRRVRRRFAQGKMRKLEEVADRANKTPYFVNGGLLNIYKACKDDDIFTLRDKNASRKQKGSVLEARNNTLEIAETVKDQQVYFYHFFDNRVGRIYSCADYFKHDGDGLAKSMLQFSKKERIGTDGWFWMMYEAANCRGWDKLPIDERVDRSEKYLDAWMKIAANPVKNKQWQKADSPFQFLAIITDIYKAINNPDGRYEYESGARISFDASCSGLQVLSAVSRDAFSAEMCNLTGSERGDYYNVIAEDVWSSFKPTKSDTKVYDDVIEQFKGVKTFDKFNKLSKELGNKLMIASAVFWSRLAKKKRKIAKRPCMTYFYKCQTETMANSLYKDWKTERGFEDLNPAFCYVLADKLFRACKRIMKGPSMLMELLVKLGMQDYKEGANFNCTTPYTGVTMEQNYNQWKTSPVWLTNSGAEGGRFRLRVITALSDKLRIHKVKSSTAANWVHMCDSQIPAWLYTNCDYDISCVHDSFSANPANAGKMFEDTRQAFYDIFKPDVLTDLLVEKNAMHLLEEIEVGDDSFLEDLFEQEFNFA